MKQKKIKLPRNPAAAALALPQYRRRSVTPKTVYKRKSKHKQEHSTWKSRFYLECSRIHHETN